jgi:hypothetical protein
MQVVARMERIEWSSAGESHQDDMVTPCVRNNKIAVAPSHQRSYDRWVPKNVTASMRLPSGSRMNAA